MKGYKVFAPDWTCRGFQYEVSQVYEMDELPVCCHRGFHFCEILSDCFDYYDFNPNNKVAEIEALGDIDSDGVKSCTNKIKIVREITWDAVLNMVNKGKGCTGMCNTGNYNAGDYNVGDFNIGDFNVGNYNTGLCNTGSYNTGSWNSGDWNKSSFNNGCFNTVETTIMLFNRPSNWTYRDWINSDAKRILNQIPNEAVVWICSKDMTDEEKAEHPEHEITDGYLKTLDASERGQIWWDGLTDKQKDIILSMPNFDKTIFKEITGIRIDEKEEKEMEE